MYLKPEKGIPFGRSLPVYAIIGSTPPGTWDAPRSEYVPYGCQLLKLLTTENTLWDEVLYFNTITQKQ